MQASATLVHQLRRELSERMERNPRYSLRAFAKALDVSHPLLSQVINGRRSPSLAFMRKVEKQLPLYKNVDSSAVEDFTTISLEEFSRISTWIHYGILGLLALPDFALSASSVGRRLNITAKRASLAIDELKAVGYIGRIKGRWQQTVPPIRVNSPVPSDAGRAFTRSLLQKAAESMDAVPFEQRSLTSITFAMANADVALADERITSFRQELCSELENRGSADAVYALMVQLIPLTHDHTKN